MSKRDTQPGDIQPRDTQSNIFPYLRYQDAPAALRWLASAFGFVTEQSYPDDEGGIAHAVLRLGTGRVLVSSAREGGVGVKTPAELGGTTQGIFIYVAEVDAHYERARAGGAEIIRELTDMDYGSREYTARDPEGHLWSFGTYWPAG